MIRHSFVFPPGHSHSTKTREIRKSKGPTQRTESDRGMTSHPRRIPKSVSRFLARGHRPTRYIQVGTRYMLHFGSESQLHRGQKTRGLSHEQKKTMAQHGRRRGQGARGSNSDTKPTPERAGAKIQALPCHPLVQPLPHIYVRIRCMSEFGRYRRFVKFSKFRHVERDDSTNCAGSKRF
jgi:hypothetical protein